MFIMLSAKGPGFLDVAIISLSDNQAYTRHDYEKHICEPLMCNNPAMKIVTILV